MSDLIDMTGERYGTYTVICRAPSPPERREAYWLCRCDCGAESARVGISLRAGIKRGQSARCPECVEARRRAALWRAAEEAAYQMAAPEEIADPDEEAKREDIEFLIGVGEHPERIARRVGVPLGYVQGFAVQS